MSPLRQDKHNDQREINGTVVVFGAGAIGRGLLGELIDSAGLTAIFVEVNAQLVQRLERAHGYTVNLVGKARATRRVTRYEILDVDRGDRIADALARCLFAATAVGGQNLASLVPLIAPGLKTRREVLNILVCENRPHADVILADALLAHGLDRDRFICVRSSVERIVRSRPETIDLLAESGQTLYADGRTWSGRRPEINGIIFCDNVDAFYARKIFTNNSGHALLAYCGHQAGCQLIHEGLAIPRIRTHLTDMLDVAARALARRFDLDRADLADHLDDLMTWRFANRDLADPIKRVARNPLRKLGPEERLVGLIRLLQPYSLPTRTVSAVIAAAMHYYDPDDPECIELKQRLDRKGPGGILEDVCGFQRDEPCYAECVEYYDQGDKR